MPNTSLVGFLPTSSNFITLDLSKYWSAVRSLRGPVRARDRQRGLCCCCAWLATKTCTDMYMSIFSSRSPYPSLCNHYGAPNECIFSDAYCAAFASVARAELRIREVDHPCNRPRLPDLRRSPCARHCTSCATSLLQTRAKNEDDGRHERGSRESQGSPAVSKRTQTNSIGDRGYDASTSQSTKSPFGRYGRKTIIFVDGIPRPSNVRLHQCELRRGRCRV